MSASFDLEAPDHFTAGAVGPPGQRVFYLQARESGRIVTLKVEKTQVAALAEYLAGFLAKRADTGGEPPSEVALLEPVEAAWTVGTLGVGHEEELDRIVVVATEVVEEESVAEPAEARFRITRPQAAAFVERARELIEAGRPLCPICSLPKDLAGHVCPRAHGHVVAPA